MKETKNFDMNKKILKPRWYLMPLEWSCALFYKVIARVKYVKTNFKSYKEPAIVLCNHASMIDMGNVVFSMFPRRVCWVASVEEFNDREWLFRHLGVFPKRKFTSDFVLIRRIAELIKKRNISVCIYPETRFSFAGINERLSPALGKLAKLCKCRVIVIKQTGNYLMSPQWGKHPYRHNKVKVEATEIFTKEEAMSLDADTLQERIEKAFEYDEYKWASEEKIRTRCKKRAENIHRILYKCPVCGKEGQMNSKGTEIWCEHCNSKWHMNEYSELESLTGKTHFKLVSDWYRWERDETYKEVNEGKYFFEDDVKLRRLINAQVKFKEIGKVHMIHDDNGFHYHGTLYDGTPFDLDKDPLSTPSTHIEFDYKRTREAIIDLNTLEDTWWVIPDHPDTLMKLNFSTEALYDKYQALQQEKLNK